MPTLRIPTRRGYNKELCWWEFPKAIFPLHLSFQGFLISLRVVGVRVSGQPFVSSEEPGSLPWDLGAPVHTTSHVRYGTVIGAGRGRGLEQGRPLQGQGMKAGGARNSRAQPSAERQSPQWASYNTGSLGRGSLLSILPLEVSCLIQAEDPVVKDFSCQGLTRPSGSGEAPIMNNSVGSRILPPAPTPGRELMGPGPASWALLPVLWI